MTKANEPEDSGSERGKVPTPWQRGETTASTGLTAGDVAKAAGAITGDAPTGKGAPSGAPTRAVPSVSPEATGQGGGPRPGASSTAPQSSSNGPAPQAPGPKGPASQGSAPKDPTTPPGGQPTPGPQSGPPSGGRPAAGAQPPGSGPQSGPQQSGPQQSGPQQSGAQQSGAQQSGAQKPGPAQSGPPAGEPQGGPPKGPAPQSPNPQTPNPQSPNAQNTSPQGPGPGGKPAPAGPSGPAAPTQAAASGGAPQNVGGRPAADSARPNQRPDLDAIHKTAASSEAADRASVRRIPASSSIGTPLRAAVQVRRVDPWSIFKVTGILAVAGFLIWMIAIAVLYGILSGMGIWDQINSSFETIVSADGTDAGSDLISSGQVFGFSALFGIFAAIVLTALATILAYIYNVCADVVGGFEVTLADLD